MFFISFFLATLSVFGAILMVQHVSEAREFFEHPAALQTNELESEDNHEIIDGIQWGARPQVESIPPLNHPVDLVIIAHTVTPTCTTVKQCSHIVASIQNYHLDGRKYPDISYNFLIGGDGNIYVGRGWDSTNQIRKESIAVSFIGNYMKDTLTKKMTEALQMLLLQGVKLGKLNENYKIVCHNQVVATLSPGVNAYNVIKTWKHYSEEKYFE